MFLFGVKIIVFFAANAAKKEICAYFDRILEHFRNFFEPSEDEDYVKVQTQTLGSFSFNTLISFFTNQNDDVISCLCCSDTLGVIARSLEERFLPISNDCATLAMNLLQNAKDPDLRRCM